MKKIIKIISLVVLLVVPTHIFAGLFTGPYRGQTNSTSDVYSFAVTGNMHGQTTPVSYMIYASKYPTFVLRLYNNNGGLVTDVMRLRSAIEHSRSTVYIVVTGTVISAAFDTAFIGNPSKIYYDARLLNHSVTRGDTVDPAATRWAYHTFTPGLFSPAEIEEIIRHGVALSIDWNGRQACDRAAAAGYGVKYFDNYCEFSQFD